MTPVEIEKALADIVIARKNACREKLDTLTSEKKTEKKALLIEGGMYDLCLNAGLVYNGTDRERVLAVKSTRMMRWLGKYPEFGARFDSADGEEKLKMTAALYGEAWMEDQFAARYKSELDAAVQAGDAEEVFGIRLKIDVVKSVLDAWQKWRVENGIYPDFVR